MLNKGDEISVRVVEVDRERGRIGLRLADDPDIAGKTVEELAVRRHRRPVMGGGNGRGGGGRGGRDGRGGARPRAAAATRRRDRDRRPAARDRDPDRG